MNGLIKKYITVLETVEQTTEYDSCVEELKRTFIEQEFDPEVFQNIVIRAKYNRNLFSEISNIDSMKRARDHLVAYLQGLLLAEGSELPKRIADLHDYLTHFYFFLEAFREVMPHKSATIKTETLRAVKIINEYDLQHLLYAALRPLWRDIRCEVVQDTGYASVRVDLIIESAETAIEVKCTRKTLSIKELTEQIAADIYHYNQKYVFVFVYDKDKAIKDRGAFERAYSKKTAEQQVFTIVLQPVYL